MRAERYYIFYKPYGILSQFTPDHPGQQCLSDILSIENDVYPIGRLDKDSEGLLFLTNQRQLAARILHPAKGHRRSYYVQLEGQPDEHSLQRLRSGVEIRIRKDNYRTLPCLAEPLVLSPDLPERHPPIRYRAAIPTQWIRMTLREGKNRQIRRMCARVGHPVLRLVRYRMMNFCIEGFRSGELREIDPLDLPESWR